LETLSLFAGRRLPSYAPDRTLASLPVRRRLHDLVGDPVLDGRHRSAPLFASMAIFFQHEGRWLTWMRRRRLEGVALHPGQLALIPSGMVQPEQGFDPEELDIWHTVLREYLEELFGVTAPTGAQFDWFYQHPTINGLGKRIDAGEADLWLTGIVVNLSTLLPEVSTTLVIHSEDWYREHLSPDLAPGTFFRVNAEYETGGVRWVEVPDSDDEIAETVTPAATVPGCAGAFWLGVDVLRASRR